MVDLGEIQAAYYMIAATGVLVAAVYYLMNLRENTRNRKIQLSMSVTDKLGTKVFFRDFRELGVEAPRDVSEFLKKYDSSVATEESIENFSKRWSMWSTFDNLGYLMREGLVDEGIIFNSQGFTSVVHWGMYWPIIDYYRRKEISPRWLENYEYMARRMWGMCKARGYTSEGFMGGFIVDIGRDFFEPESSKTVQ